MIRTQAHGLIPSFRIAKIQKNNTKRTFVQFCTKVRLKKINNSIFKHCYFK
jgi:hypothetical protein